MIRNWDKYKRMDKIQEKAIANDQVKTMFQQHYKEIYYLYKINPDVFNDTYLYLTRKYNPDSTYTFKEQFIGQFKNLSRSYILDDTDNKFIYVDSEILDYSDKLHQLKTNEIDQNN